MTQPTELETAAAGPSDAELIAAVRGGDTEAYGVLFARHAGAARNLARQHARNDSDADDLVAEAFAKILQVLQAGGGPDVAFRAYLFTTLRRVAYDRTRAGSRVQLTDDIAAYDPGVPFVDPALEGLEKTLVASAYATLPERWRAVLWHTEVEGLSAAEVAPILGLTANGVSALAYRAREGLRQAYLQQHLSAPLSESRGCAAVNDKLGAYARGGLSKRETAQVEEHLGGCVDCRGLVAELADVNHGMRAVIAPLILGLLGMGLLKGGLLLGGTAAAGTAAAALHPEGVTTGAAAGVGAGAAAAGAGLLVGAGAGGAGGAGAAAGGTAAGTTIVSGGGSALARAAARWSLNPSAAAGVAAAVVGIVALSAIGVAALNDDDGGPAVTGGGPVLTAPVVAPGGTESPGVVPSGSPTPPTTPTQTGMPGPTSTPNVGSTDGPTPGSSSGASPSQSGGSNPSASASPTSGPTSSPTTSPSPTPSSPSPTPPVAPPVLTLALEPLGDLVAGRSGVIGFTAGNSGEGAAETLTADVTLPPGVTLSGTTAPRFGGRSAGLLTLAPFAVADGWACTSTTDGAHCTGPAVDPGATVTAYLEVVAAPDSAGDTPVSVTVSAPGADPVTVTGTSGVAPDGPGVSVADSGRVGVTEVGAPMLSCSLTARGCDDAQGRQGQNLNNDDWTMTRLDDDADESTTISSSTALEVPKDATITWAGLYWSANVPNGGTEETLSRIRLAGPGQSYVEVTADRLDTGVSTGTAPNLRPAYQAFAEVTDQVVSAGPGTWWAADAAVRSGASNIYGGWSLVVVYAADSLPEGKVSVVDGFGSVTPGNNLTLTLPGTEGLQARVGLVSWEGDAGIEGDTLTLDGKSLTPSGGSASAANVADSHAVGSAYANTFGVDAKPLTGATFTAATAKVTASTKQDVFLIGVLTVSSQR